jgi:hypothetical protein
VDVYTAPFVSTLTSAIELSAKPMSIFAARDEEKCKKFFFSPAFCLNVHQN